MRNVSEECGASRTRCPSERSCGLTQPGHFFAATLRARSRGPRTRADRGSTPVARRCALCAAPGRAAPGVVYEALIASGPASAQVFSEGLRSPNEHVRIASSFGLGSILEPEASRRSLEHMLVDDSAPVRAAA